MKFENKVVGIEGASSLRVGWRCHVSGFKLRSDSNAGTRLRGVCVRVGGAGGLPSIVTASLAAEAEHRKEDENGGMWARWFMSRGTVQ